MSHSGLFLQNVLDLKHFAHLDIALERLRHLQQQHAKRIEQSKLDRKIITGDIWRTQPDEDDRRVTLSTGSQLVNLGSAMLLPRFPTISVMPLSQDYYAQVEADTVQRWIYAALDSLGAVQPFNDWAKEVLLGVGGLHLIPHKLALPDEVPVILDVPEATAIYYHMGPRGTVDYCFIRHEMTELDLNRMLGAYSPRTDNDMVTRETWCYYTEERWLHPESGQVEKRILYGILNRGDWIYPLTDITTMMPEIPVFLAFNADGFNWRGKEEMRARGIYTAEQESLLVASDMFTQLINGTFGAINPPVGVYSDDNTDHQDLDLRPGAQNHMSENERVEQILTQQPSNSAYAMMPSLMRHIASSTIPQLDIQTKDLEGVSGAAFTESMQAVTVRNGIRQSNMALAIKRLICTLLKHQAAVVEPLQSLSIYGADPRDNRQIEAIVHPAMLLKHTRIHVRMTQQTPRALWQYLSVIGQLGDRGYLPRQLVTEQSAELLQLPVTDMTSTMAQIAADDAYKIQMEVLKAKAAESMGYLQQTMHNKRQQQTMHNKRQQPALLQDGTAPTGMHSEMLDPVMQASTQPMTMQPVNGGY